MTRIDRSIEIRSPPEKVCEMKHDVACTSVSACAFAQFAGGQIPQDLLEQQEEVASADALVFVHPMLSASFPTILKIWIDRVFSYGFAYRASEKGTEGLSKHEKALLINMTGAR